MVRGAEDRHLPLASSAEFDSVAGKRIGALIEGRHVHIGNHGMLADAGCDTTGLDAEAIRLVEEGKTRILFAVDGAAAVTVGRSFVLRGPGGLALCAGLGKCEDGVVGTAPGGPR